MIVNIPEMLRDTFNSIQDEYYLKNNTSHFNTKQTSKIEYILVLDI